MDSLLSALLAFLRAALRSRPTLALDNAALRQQLTIYQRAQKRVRLRAEDRAFWVVLQNAVRDPLVHSVLNEYYRDWRTVIGALFMTNPSKR